MAGSLRQVPGRTGTWELRVYLGRDAEGRVRHRYVRFHGSRRLAERELARLVTEQETTPAPPLEQPRQWGPATTVNDAIAAWRDNGWDDLSPKTAGHYESIWRVHIEGSIGRRKIATLTTYDVERFYRSLKARGSSQALVRQVKAVLHRSCRLAQKWSGGRLQNPAADADLPAWRLEERREAVRSPEVAEVRALISAAEEEDVRFGVFLRLLASTFPCIAVSHWPDCLGPEAARPWPVPETVRAQRPYDGNDKSWEGSVARAPTVPGVRRGRGSPLAAGGNGEVHAYSCRTPSRATASSNAWRLPPPIALTPPVG